ncbi:MAG: peptidase U32 family protein, partial [Hydrogenophaga sp.]
MLPHHIELLSPARDADIGIEAVNHGADAVYIGGPSFGARTSADNRVQDIARLARHAHRFGSRVYVTVNTILRDDELEPARKLAWQL